MGKLTAGPLCSRALFYYISPRSLRENGFIRSYDQKTTSGEPAAGWVIVGQLSLLSTVPCRGRNPGDFRCEINQSLLLRMGCWGNRGVRNDPIRLNGLNSLSCIKALFFGVETQLKVFLPWIMHYLWDWF